MQYPLVIHKEADTQYGVIVPDLPGCHSAGATLDEAIVMAREAILGHLEALIDTGQDVPQAQPVETHRANPDYADADYWALVDVDLANLPGKAKRVNVSIQERVLENIDQFARQHGESRSSLLQRAATRYITEQRRQETG